MPNILVNGLNSKVGGGKSILTNYLTLLSQSCANERYYVLTPNKEEYMKYARDFLSIIDINSFYKKSIMFPFVYHYLMPKLLIQYRIDYIFNLGDIVVPVQCPQLYLFDWPYAIYPQGIVWEKMDLNSYISRKIKLSFWKSNLKYATTVIAQTTTSKRKLESLYGLSNIAVVPNAVSVDNLGECEPITIQLPKNKIKLLYLSHYYTHKNVEIFVPLAKKIKENGLQLCLVLTIDESHHPRAKRLINEVKQHELTDVIYNIGPVAMKHVPSLYRQCDGLLMPTLLESFSGTYVEAMFHEIPILTSNLDFARDVCGDAAFYFDPLEVESIFAAIVQAFEQSDQIAYKIEMGKRRLSQLLSWNEAFASYQKLLKDDLSKPRE